MIYFGPFAGFDVVEVRSEPRAKKEDAGTWARSPRNQHLTLKAETKAVEIEVKVSFADNERMETEIRDALRQFLKTIEEKEKEI